MNERSKKQSTIKKGLMMLNKLKGIQSGQEKPKAQNKNLCINAENELKKYQVKLVSTDEMMLSNADFHVKNLLTGFLEDIDDKTGLGIESTIKKLRHNQNAKPQPLKPVSMIEEDFTWKKSLTNNKKKNKSSHKIPNVSKHKDPNKKISNTNINFDSDLFGRINSYNKQNKECNRSRTRKRTVNLGKESMIKKKLNTLQSKNENSLLNSNFSMLNEQNILEQSITSSQLLLNKTNDNNISQLKLPSTKKQTIKKLKEIKSMLKKNGSNQSIPKVQNKEEFSLKNSLTKRSMKKQDFEKKKSKASSQHELDRVNLFDFFQEPEVFKEENYVRAQTFSKIDLRNKITKDSKEHNDCLSEDIVTLKVLSKRNLRELESIRNELKQNVFMQNDESTPNKDEDNQVKYITTIEEDNHNDNHSSNNLLVNNNSTGRSSNNDKYRILTRKGYVYDSLDDEEFEDEVEGYFYLKPNALVLYIIDGFTFSSTLYSLVYTPYSLAHDLDLDCRANYSFLLYLEVFIDLVMIADLLINFFVAYYNFEEILITDLREIIPNYLLTWFFVDSISALPFNSILLLRSTSCKYDPPLYYNTGSKNFINILVIFRLFKLFKVFSYNRMSNLIQKTLNHIIHFNRWHRIFMMVFFFLFTIHTLSCLFIFFGQNAYPSWIIKTNLDTSSFMKIYITSIYYILQTVTTVGYGDISGVNYYERFFSLILLLVGIMVYSYAVTSMSTYIKEQDEKTLDYQKKCKILEDIRISHKKMSYELYDKIARYLKYRMMNEKKDKNIIIECLPIGLRNNLIFEMYKPIIRNFVFFKNFDNMDFIVRVILAFRPILAVHSDILVKEGDYIEEVIFVKTGSLNLEIPLPLEASLKQQQNFLMKHPTATSFSMVNTTNNKIKNSMLLFHLTKSGTTKHSIYSEEDDDDNKISMQYIKILEIRKNEHFGDILMFLNKRSPLCVKVKSKITELFFLKKTDAVEISMSYPQIWRKIIKKSLFNMEQIERLINKVIKLCKNVNGIKNTVINSNMPTYIQPKNEDNESLLDKESCELHSIPSSFKSSESFNSEISPIDDSSHYEEYEHKNSTIHEDSDEQSDKLSSLISSTKKQLKDAPTTLVESSSNLNDENTIKEKEEAFFDKEKTIKETTEAKHIEDNLIDMQSTKINNNTIATMQFKSSEINTELYPNELSSDDPSFQSLLKASYQCSKRVMTNLIASPSERSVDDINKKTIVYNINHYNLFNDYLNRCKTKKLSDKDINDFLKEKMNKAQRFDSLSISTQLSIMISSEYDNLNELSNYTYSNNESLKNQVKSLLTKRETLLVNIINDEETGTKRISPRPNRSSIQVNASSSLSSKSPKRSLKKSKSINFSQMAIPNTSQTPGIAKRSLFDSPIHHHKPLMRKASSPKALFHYRQKRQSSPVINLVSMKKKPDLLNLISQNIEKNSLNLNNPERFYSEYFQKLVDNQNQLKEEQNLYKRLLNTEKLLKGSIQPIDESIRSESDSDSIDVNNNI